MNENICYSNKYATCNIDNIVSLKYKIRYSDIINNNID